MTIELLIALVGFALVTSITPGPNNLMLLASGANFGVRRTVPHMLGISIGHAFMVALLGFGLVGLLDAVPLFDLILKVASVLYMLWLAWKIANAAAPEKKAAEGRPFTFLQAAAFQWVNPKSWAMALASIAAYAPTRSVEAVVLVAVIFACVNLPSVGVWAVLGVQMRRFLTNANRLRLFNWTMAILLILSLVPIVMH